MVYAEECLRGSAKMRICVSRTAPETGHVLLRAAREMRNIWTTRWMKLGNINT